jgi:hypothetical protein
MRAMLISFALLLVASTASATPKTRSAREAAADAERDIAAHYIKFYLWAASHRGQLASPISIIV